MNHDLLPASWLKVVLGGGTFSKYHLIWQNRCSAGCHQYFWHVYL